LMGLVLGKRAVFLMTVRGPNCACPRGGRGDGRSAVRRGRCPVSTSRGGGAQLLGWAGFPGRRRTGFRKAQGVRKLYGALDGIVGARPLGRGHFGVGRTAGGLGAGDEVRPRVVWRARRPLQRRAEVCGTKISRGAGRGNPGAASFGR